jgi:hypothetical protein
MSDLVIALIGLGGILFVMWLIVRYDRGLVF